MKAKLMSGTPLPFDDPIGFFKCLENMSVFDPLKGEGVMRGIVGNGGYFNLIPDPFCSNRLGQG